MSRNRPLAYLHRVKEKWVVTCVVNIENMIEADTRQEAVEIGSGIGWDVRRFTPWDDPPTK